MKFYVSMYIDNRYSPIEDLGHTPKVKVKRLDFWIVHHCEVGQESLLVGL